MAGLFWIVVLLVLVLTGAIVPVLIFGGWVMVVILIVVFVALAFFKFGVAIIRGGAEILGGVTSPFRPPKYPTSKYPEYSTYLHWANKTGEFGRVENWETVKGILRERRNADKIRETWKRGD